MPDDGQNKVTPSPGESFLATSVDVGHDAATDPRLVGRTVGQYQVLEELGRGGMGVVYRAHDRRLARDVALKFLPGFLTNDLTARRRFIAEAKAASALDHPNICTIHEIGETPDGRVYIAMAFYDGETLKTKMARGPIPLHALLDYGVQISRGLSKAHGKGIVHRDIKPANVMVTADGTVKILDFGTAKVGDLQLTQTGNTVGTVAYMSPEQAEGDPVDARSDLWSVGALLYQMASGEIPFRGGRPVAVIYSILNEEPRPLDQLAQVPPDLGRAVGRCLKKAPNDRFASAHDLAGELERIAQIEGVEITLSGRGARTRPPARRSSRRWFGGALALLLLVATIPATRSALLSTLGLGSQRTYLAVLPFTPSENVVAAGLTSSLTSMIAQLGSTQESLWVVPSSEIARLAVSDWRSAWNELGVTTLIEGVVEAQGTVTLNLIETDGSASRVVNSTQLPGPDDARFLAEARRALAGFLDLGGPITTLASAEADVAPDAYPYYLRGVGYLERFYDRANLERAAGLFQQALQEDPRYAPARAGLCRANWELYVWTGDAALARAAESECDRAAALAQDAPPVLISLASAYLLTGRHDRAREELERVLELEPQSPDAYRWMGKVFEDEGRPEEAERAYRRAIELRPEIWVYHDDLGQLLLYDGRAGQAAELFEHVGRLVPESQLADIHLGAAMMQQHRVAEADSFFRRSIAKRPDAIAYRNLGHLYFLEQEYDVAVRELEAGLDVTESDWWSWRLLGHAYYWDGNAAEAARAWHRAVVMAEGLLGINPNDVDALTGLAELHAALDAPDRARPYLSRVAGLPLKWNLIPFYAGRAHEMLGDRDQALAYVERALEAKLAPVWVERDPWLQALREDPRYVALRRRFPSLQTDVSTQREP